MIPSWIYFQNCLKQRFQNLFQFLPRQFDEDVSDKTFRERYRVPRNVLDKLEEVLSEKLKHNSRRNQSLSPRDQIKIFLHFLGKRNWQGKSFKI